MERQLERLGLDEKHLAGLVFEPKEEPGEVHRLHCVRVIKPRTLDPKCVLYVDAGCDVDALGYQPFNFDAAGCFWLR